MDSLKYVDFLIYGDGKALGTGESYCVLPSHLSLVRGLKPEVVADEENEWRSHLSQVRGLKRLRLYGPVGEVKSHPTRVRGLKQLGDITKIDPDNRTLRGCAD